MFSCGCGPISNLSCELRIIIFTVLLEVLDVTDRNAQASLHDVVAAPVEKYLCNVGNGSGTGIEMYR